MTGYPLRPLGEVLERDSESVPVETAGTYRVAGIYSFGRGVFARGLMGGTDTQYTSLNRLRAGQFVISRLKAFEGATAVVPPEFDGWFLSQEFPTFSLTDRADVKFIGYLCQWPDFWRLLQRASKGVGARRERVHPERLLTIEVPLPAIHEQRRVADKLDRLFERVGAAVSAGRRSHADRLVSLYPAIVDGVLSQYASERSRIGDVVEMVSDVVHPGDDPAPAERFVGLQHIESHTGRRLGELPIGGEKGRKFRFLPGDVIYGYLRPYLNKVWLANCAGLCSVDQYVLRPTGTSGTLLAHALRSRTFLAEAIRLTHNLQLPRLRSGLLVDIEVPQVRGSDEMRAEAELDARLDRVLRLLDLRRYSTTLAGALQPAILSRAFAGEL